MPSRDPLRRMIPRDDDIRYARWADVTEVLAREINHERELREAHERGIAEALRLARDIENEHFVTLNGERTRSESDRGAYYLKDLAAKLEDRVYALERGKNREEGGEELRKRDMRNLALILTAAYTVITILAYFLRGHSP